MSMAPVLGPGVASITKQFRNSVSSFDKEGFQICLEFAN
jgi:hypothetical protein